jgi:feruloyl esterase
VGWADSAIAPMNSVNYYNQVRDVTSNGSPEEIQKFYRLFMVPGMAHCGGGDGPNAFGNGVDGPVVDADHDLLKALERWVEQGIAPNRFIATHYVNNNPSSDVQFQRLLCAFPKVARFKGGDPNNSASFECVHDEHDQDPRNQNLDD